MSSGLREVQPHELDAELERVLLPRLADILADRGPGHCMRVSDLDVDLMVRLCRRLRDQFPEGQVYVLSDGRRASVPQEVVVTSSKLVELRNPLPDGTLRPPLLVFVPGGLRAAAEDSFGVATFEEVAVGDVYRELAELLVAELPNGLRPTVAELLRRLEALDWLFADSVAVVRYLLTLKLNDYDPDAAGAALFELGLVPDFRLFDDLGRTPLRLQRNLEKVRILTQSGRSERGRVLELGLAERGFRAALANFLNDVGLEDPRAWTRRIVVERENWPLAFHHWKFDDEESRPDSIRVEVTAISLPTVGEDEEDPSLGRLIGQQYLPIGKRGLKQFSVTFRTLPSPSKVQGLARFSIQVVSQEGGPTGLVRNIAAWRSAKDQATVTFTKLSRVDWEEGWHLVRVQPLTADNDPIPLTQEGERALNESDLFYVLPGGEIDVPPPQRAVPREDSLVHAWKRLQFAALLDGRDPSGISPQEVRWKGRSDRGRTAAEVIEARFGREGVVHVPVSRQLKVLEQRILASPSGPLSWRLPVRLGQAGEAVAEADQWPQSPQAAAFMAARAQYFEAVRSGSKELVTQAADLYELRSSIVAYAESYEALISFLLRRVEVASGASEQRELSQLRDVLALDTVTLEIADHRGEHREAALISPTHPLRALWLATWAQVGDMWLKAAAEGQSEHLIATRDGLLRGLVPLSFPSVLARGHGKLLTAVDNLTPFWTLYAPTGDEDPRSLVGDVCAALSLAEPGIGGATITGTYLASRVERYLAQHPYVRTLTINAFNPGRASILAEMLLELQAKSAFADLCYDIRLFTPDPQARGAGEALTDLLSPSGGTAAREADAFALLRASHLHPKLGLAVRSTTEFGDDPERHSAHLTFLFDVFPGEEVAAGRADSAVIAPVHGLLQAFRVDYTEEDVVAWRKRPRHGQALELPGAEELTDLLSSVPALLSNATAAVATSQVGTRLAPVVTLALDDENRSLIHRVHEVSDWVITVDRNMGIEFFDHGGRSERPDYLIDHSPDMTSDFGHRLVITSRSLEELEAMVEPVLRQYGLTVDTGRAVALLDQLRSLSGRLALKLVSLSSRERAEVLGLALARLYLDYQGVLRNQVLVPLDAHLELYRALGRQAEEVGDEISFKRTDLALFDLDLKLRTITCRLVEVKCYTSVRDIAGYNQLKDRIAEQLSQSEQVLATHFDPGRTRPDRPDRPLKTHELATLLEFYLDRAVRYGLFASDAVEEALALLSTLERGYRLDFTRSGLVFDLEKPGTEPAENEGGVEFHRVGKDLVQELLDAVTPGASIFKAAKEGEAPAPGARPSTLSEQELSVPRLADAAFLAPARERGSRSEPEIRIEEPQPIVEEHEPPPSEGSTIAAASGEAETGPADAQDVPATSMTPRGVLETSGVKLPPEPDGTADRGAPHEAAADVLLGVTRPSPQYGIIGEMAGRKVALDLNETHTISLFGVQGGGKSYTLGTIIETASLSIPNINRLPRPLATIVFHYSATQDYKPEFTSMVAPNTHEDEQRALRERYGAEPEALSDVVLLVPEGRVEERRAEYPGIEVRTLKFAVAELQASHWRFLMGAVGNQSTYIRQLNSIMKGRRDDLSLPAIRDGVDASRLPDHLKELAHQRLDLAAEYIDDDVRLADLVRPGRLIIVDLRDEFIEKDEALGLFVVLLQLFADARYDGKSFNKLVVFDEAHKYIDSPDLVAGLIDVARQMRHKGTSIVIASQDPPSVPVSLIELSSQIILHRFNSPAWLKHLQKANAALGGLTAEKIARLGPGEAFVWSSRATDEAFSNEAVKIRCRPRVTQHGGTTKTAVE